MKSNKVIEECKKAGISFWIASDIALSLDQEKDYSEKEFYDAIAGELEKKDPELAEDFRNYHNINVRTSSHFLEGFDREKIVSSLLKETKIHEKVAREISREVEDEIRKMKLSSISGSLIREIANTKLIKKGLLEEKFNYTRVGVPVYDVTRVLENFDNPERTYRNFASQVLTEYTLARILPEHVSRAHLRGDLYIHKLDHFPTKAENLFLKLEDFLKSSVSYYGIRIKPSGEFHSSLIFALRLLRILQTQISNCIGIDLSRLNDSEPADFRRYMQDFITELKFMILRHRYFSFTFNFDKWGKFSRELAAETPSEVYFAVSSATPDIYRDLNPNLFFVNSGNFVYPDNHFTKSGQGTVQEVTLNMPRMGNSCTDEREIFENLDKLLQISREVLKIKMKILERRIHKDKSIPSMSRFYDLSASSFTVSFSGLPECIREICGSNIYSEDGRNLALRILAYIRRTLESFSKEDGLNYRLGENDELPIKKRFRTLDARDFSKSHSYRTISQSVSRLSFYSKVELLSELYKDIDAGYLTVFRKPGRSKFPDVLKTLQKSSIRCWTFES